MWQSSTGQWYINPVMTSSLLWTDTEMWQSSTGQWMLIYEITILNICLINFIMIVNI
jgi:hypothetical protein